MSVETRRTYLVLSQTYIPDQASVGQHTHDVAAELVRRGHRVVVLTANRGYDDPGTRYRTRETIDGVEIVRLPLSAFGKATMSARVAAGALYALQAVLRGLGVRKVAGIVVNTSPPLALAAAVALAALKRAPLIVWVTDLNPDQSIALGVIEAGSLQARLLDVVTRHALARAAQVVVLDRFMAARVARKVDVAGRLSVIPPWPHDRHLEPVAHEENPFRHEKGLDGSVVLMYSGNHTPSNPLTTVLQAAAAFEDDPGLLFLFVGGGIGRAEVAAATGANIRALPYEPLARLRYSLSAADVHIVVIGDDMVGRVHPSKIYGAMAVARPVLVVSPAESHLTELLDEASIGWHVQHGDVKGAVDVIRRIRHTPAAELAAMGQRARDLAGSRYSQARLCGELCDVIERSTG